MTKAAKSSPLMAALVCLIVGIATGLVRGLTDLPGLPVLLGGMAITVAFLVVVRRHSANVVVFCLGAVIVEIVLKR